MRRESLYEAHNINKAYGGVVALSDVEFSVRGGEVVGLVGDNGAGKSTLVRILSGAASPDRGEILLDEVPQRWRSPHDALAAGIETLYQDSGVAPDLTVAANVFLGREVVRKGWLGRLGFLDEKTMRETSRQQLERIGISVPGADRAVSKLSGGQRQAVAIGRTVMWAKKIILLDEPTNHLGAQQSMEVLAVIRQAKSHGLGVVFISHTLPQVLEATDRITVLRLGRVVANAPTATFTHESLLRAITGLQ